LHLRTAFDPIEDRFAANIRATIEAVFNEDWTVFLAVALWPNGRGGEGYRHGNRGRPDHRDIWAETTAVPRGRIEDAAGKVSECDQGFAALPAADQDGRWR